MFGRVTSNAKLMQGQSTVALGKAPARGMEDVSTYPVLTAELLKRGYTDDETD